MQCGYRYVTMTGTIMKVLASSSDAIDLQMIMLVSVLGRSLKNVMQHLSLFRGRHFFHKNSCRKELF